MTSTESFIFVYCMVNTFCIALFIILLCNINSNLANFIEATVFKVGIVCAGVHGIADIIWILGQSGIIHFPFYANYIMSSLMLIAIIGTTYMWFLYVESRVHPQNFLKRGFHIVTALPMVVSIVINSISYWTGAMFSISPNGDYIRGPLFMLQMMLEYLYPLAALIRSFMHFKDDTVILSVKEKITINLFVASAMFAGLIQILFPELIVPITLPGISVAFLFMFVHLQSRRIYTDALTDLNNRRRADEYLKAKLAQTEENSFYLFILDVDKFKKINDTYGHLEGDKALVAVAEAMRRTCGGYGGFAARYGGDEFMMIFGQANINSPEEIEETFRKRLADCKKTICPNIGELGVSIGYALCDKKDITAEDLISWADVMLYAQKRDLHLDEQSKTFVRQDANGS